MAAPLPKKRNDVIKRWAKFTGPHSHFSAQDGPGRTAGPTAIRCRMDVGSVSRGGERRQDQRGVATGRRDDSTESGYVCQASSWRAQLGWSRNPHHWWRRMAGSNARHSRARLVGEFHQGRRFGNEPRAVRHLASFSARSCPATTHKNKILFIIRSNKSDSNELHIGRTRVGVGRTFNYRADWE